MTQPVLQIENLVTEFRNPKGWVRAVNGVSLEVDKGEMVALVGASGSGKSALLRSIVAAHRAHPGVVAGSVVFNFEEQLHPYEGIESAVRRRLDAQGKTTHIRVRRGWQSTVERRMRPLRGQQLGLVLQDGRTALDPSRTLAQQFGNLSAQEAQEWLAKLGFEDPASALGARPHQLSGGMAQRAMLAAVLCQKPQLLLLDELTTGLDVSLQASVLKLLERLHLQLGFTAVIVTHDLGLARTISTRTMIMDEGSIVDSGETESLFGGATQRSHITERLLEAGRQEGSTSGVESSLPVGAPPLIEAKNVRRVFQRDDHTVVAVDGVSLKIPPGQCVALVGESGSGKTTLAHILAGLNSSTEGSTTFAGHTLANLPRELKSEVRRRRTILFQNPYTSLNPKMTPRQTISEALRFHQKLESAHATTRAQELLEDVGLGDRADALLEQLSGGERRRVGLLRAMSSHADVVILDEPTAGLDALNRKQVAKLITAAQTAVEGRSTLLVSHDLGFVTRVADRVVVLFRGRIVEDTSSRAFASEATRHHPYTELLWRAARYVAGDRSGLTQIPERRRDLGETSALAQTAGGCLYRTRCSIYRAEPERWATCERQRPDLLCVGGPTWAACHGVQHEM